MVTFNILLALNYVPCPITFQKGHLRMLWICLQKYFDSGDYNMAKAAMNNPKKPLPLQEKLLLQESIGEGIPTPEDLPPRKPSIIQSKLASGALSWSNIEHCHQFSSICPNLDCFCHVKCCNFYCCFGALLGGQLKSLHSDDIHWISGFVDSNSIKCANCNTLGAILLTVEVFCERAYSPAWG